MEIEMDLMSRDGSARLPVLLEAARQQSLPRGTTNESANYLEGLTTESSSKELYYYSM